MSDFVHCGKQLDDLPAFSRVKEIIIIAGIAMLYVETYTTLGINNHLMCHAIQRTHMFKIVSITNLSETNAYTAHSFIGDGQLYIAMCYDILV